MTRRAKKNKRNKKLGGEIPILRKASIVGTEQSVGNLKGVATASKKPIKAVGSLPTKEEIESGGYSSVLSDGFEDPYYHNPCVDTRSHGVVADTLIRVESSPAATLAVAMTWSFVALSLVTAFG